MTEYHHPREFIPDPKAAHVIGDAGIWENGSFRKPIQQVRVNGKRYATNFSVVFGGNFGAFEIWDAMREVAVWDGVTESARIRRI